MEPVWIDGSLNRINPGKRFMKRSVVSYCRAAFFDSSEIFTFIYLQ